MYHNPLALLLLVLALFLVQVGNAQHLPGYYVQHYDTNDGLSNNWISAITSDEHGYLWLGTQYGLNRFDGHRFNTYTYDASQPDGLAANWIRSLHADSNQLWIGSEGGGFTLLNIKEERFLPPNLPPALRGSSIFRIQDWEDDNTKLLSSSEGVFLVSRNGNYRQILQQKSNQAIGGDKEVIWIATRNGLNRCASQKTTDSCITLLPEATIHDFIVLGPDSLLVFKNQTVQKLYLNSNGSWQLEDLGIVAPHHPQFFYTPVLYPDSKQNIWASGQDGLWLLSADLSSKKWLPVESILPYNSQEKPSLHCIHEDQHGVIWIGTNQGLLQLTPTKTFVHPQLADDRGRLAKTRTIYSQDDHYLFAGPDTLFHWHRSMKSPQVLSTGTFVSIHTNQNGEIYGVGNRNGDWQLLKINLTNLQVVVVPCPPLATKNQGNWKIIKSDQNGRLWISNWHNFIGYDPLDKSIIVPKLSWQGKPLEDLSIADLLIDDQDRLWLASVSTGLISIANISTITSASRVECSVYQYQADEPQSISSNVVQALHLDQAKQLWIGTDGGLNRWVEEKQQFRRWVRNRAMPDDKILDIVSTPNGTLWLSTASHGILAFNPTDNSFQSYTQREGLFSDDMLIGSAHIDTEGRIWMGSSSGLHAFLPEQVTKNTVLTDTLIWQKSLHYRTDTILETPFPLKGFAPDQPLLIHPADHTVQLSFAWLNFRYSGEQQYQYLLSNIHPDWVPATSDGIISLAQLPPGRYTLSVRAHTNGQAVQATASTIHIRVLAPWYRSTLAKILYSLAALGLAYLIYRMQLSRQLAAAERAQTEALIASKMQFFQQIAHEFRSPLTLVLGAIEQIKNRLTAIPAQSIEPHIHQLEEQTEYLTRQVDEVLELAKLEAAQNPLQLTTADFVRYQRLLLESFGSIAERQGIELQFTSEIAALPLSFDADKWRKITSNLISNALKFTGTGGTIKLSLHLENKADQRMLHYSLTDNGAGIDSEFLPHIFEAFSQGKTHNRQGTGIGLALTKALVEQHGGTIKVSSQPGVGSTFSIHLPVPKNAALPELSLPPEPPVQGDQQVVLIAEDMPAVRTYLKDCLAEHYLVREAENGLVAWELCLSELPDIVVSDVMMPGGSGLELSERIRGNKKTNHIPLVLLTGKNTPKDRIEGLRAGADVYLTKPFHQQELLLTVERLLALRRRLQEKYKSGNFTVQTESHTTDNFMKQVANLISAEMSNENLTVEALAQELHLSRVQLFRKIKALTDLTPTLLIRQIRLQNAHRLLSESDLSISEIAYSCGFKDPAYFSRVYKENYGHPPSNTRE